ncbi:MAG: type II toxin-antitoxin system death-on-curing family toxin [Gemmatimonadetes bacterium]|nr:type II toxin-antitoxin system death-on-curing family toxin [Gemmatimonadota bacterium]
MDWEPQWLTRAIVEAIHHEQIEEHGGSFGTRDEGLIDSALSRPHSKWQYDPSADLFTLAAAYAFGLAKNHGFIDGNKRVAFMAAYVFLGIHDVEVEAQEPEVVEVMTALASGEVSEQEMANWLRGHSAEQ